MAGYISSQFLICISILLLSSDNCMFNVHKVITHNNAMVCPKEG